PSSLMYVTVTVTRPLCSHARWTTCFSSWSSNVEIVAAAKPRGPAAGVAVRHAAHAAHARPAVTPTSRNSRRLITGGKGAQVSVARVETAPDISHTPPPSAARAG